MALSKVKYKKQLIRTQIRQSDFKNSRIIQDSLKRYPGSFTEPGSQRK